MTNDVTTIEKPKTLGEAKQRAYAVPMQHRGGSFTPDFSDMGQVMEFAATMAGAGVMVGPAVRGNPGACMAVTMMAGRFGLDPFMLSTKAYIVKNQAGVETLNWEAQAVNAMILGSGVLEGPLAYEYIGEGSARQVRVFGTLKGGDEREVLTNRLSAISGKSPLWKNDPDQQLAYYGSRMWVRRHAAHVLMGVYTADDVDGGEIVNVTPKDDPAARLTASITGKTVEPEDEPEAEAEPAQADEAEEATDDPEPAAEATQQADTATEGPNPDDEWHNLDEIEAAFSEDHSELELGATLDTALALSWVTDAQAKEINELAKVRQGEIA